jgi:hypothetical protein
VQRYGPPIEAVNEGYVSVSVAVPSSVLLAALSQMLVVSWVGEETRELITQASLQTKRGRSMAVKVKQHKGKMAVDLSLFLSLFG